MEYKFMTPLQVWENFNPTSEDLSIDVVRSQEIDGTVYEKIYFTVKKTEKGICRAYALTAKPKKKGKLPVMLIIPPFSGKEIDESLVSDVVKDGYVAVVVDLEGETSQKNRYTFYPDDLDYCNKERAGEHILYAKPSARDTTWFNWTCVIRRAITLISELEYADDSKIILVGIDEGSLVAWQTAGIDGRLLAMVSVFGYKTERKEEDKEEKDCWLSGVDQRSYAPFITIPVLHVGGTNTEIGATELIEKTAEKMNEQSDFYADYGFGNAHSLYSRQINTIKEFVKKVFDGEKFIDVPTFDVETGIDGEYKIKINATGAKSAEIWYGYLTEPAKIFWKKIEAGKKGGEMIANFSLGLSNEKVVVYARANYSKFSVVSRPIFIEVKSVAPSFPDRSFTRILFDGTTVKNLIPVMEGKIVFDDPLEVKEGALGLMGVTSNGGGIGYVFDPEQPVDLSVSESLQFEVYTLNECMLDVRLYSGERVYKAEKRFKKGSNWQRVHLPASAFKNENMQKLTSFDSVWKLELPKLNSVLIRNVLLI